MPDDTEPGVHPRWTDNPFKILKTPEWPQCFSCKWWINGNTCYAFPDGIPAQIIVHGQKHDTPIEGDHGLQYQKREAGK